MTQVIDKIISIEDMVEISLMDNPFRPSDEVLTAFLDFVDYNGIDIDIDYAIYFIESLLQEVDEYIVEQVGRFHRTNEADTYYLLTSKVSRYTYLLECRNDSL